MRSAVIYMFLYLFFVEETFSSVRVLTSNCPNLVLKNGKVKKRQRGRFVKFVCNTGYMLAGERFSTCSYGKWDHLLPPKCVRPTCANKPNPPNNGLIYPTHSGAALHIYCKPGYQIRGPSDIYCDGRKWDNNMPVCLPADTKPKLFCDFEEEDLCGWSHDLNHDFDWRRENYKTPSGSIGTGPSFDHTKGQGSDGYYVYIESSSRNENDTAKLISPIFEKTNKDTCLEFFYHMYGATTGSLRVYIKKVSQSWTLDSTTLIFSKSGNQGDRWYRSFSYLGPTDEDYQIIIEGIRGSGYVSDIAVDDVKIIEDCVYEEETTTTEMDSSTEYLLTIESCESRCGHKANENETLQITCDCDESCYDSNRCCPDYLDFCLTGTTSEDYLTTTDMPNEIIVTNLDTYSLPPAHIFTSEKPTTQQIKSFTTAKTTTIAITSKASTKKMTTKTAATSTTTKKTYLVTRPTLQFLTQPTQPTFVQKIIPSVPTKPKKNKTQIIYVKPKKVDTKYKENESKDVLEVPRPTNSDEELFLSPIPDTNVKPIWRTEPLDTPFIGNFSEKDKFLSVREPPSPSHNVLLVVITVLGITVLITVISFVIFRRYRSRHRRMAYSNGDSQSDVRYLTSDEVLNFSLDPDYDNL